MKNTYRSILAIVALAMFTVSTATVQAEDYTYETNNGTITIYAYTGPGGDVTIPASVNGLSVTSIGMWCFASTTVTSVTIPNSVTNIGFGAFQFSTLTTLFLPDTVSSIEAEAFADCYRLKAIMLPKNLSNIGPSAFGGCSELSAIEVDPQNPVYASVDRVLFDKHLLTIVQCPAGRTGPYNIPNSIRTIGGNAFYGCSKLTSVTIPDGVTCIQDGYWSLCNGRGAFDSCTSLKSITIPNSVTNIGDYAFQFCTNLTSVYFGGNTPNAGDVLFGGFFGGDLSTTIYYLPGTTGWDTEFGGRPTAPWLLPHPTILTSTPNFGIQTNQFGFRISWATNASVVIEAASALANPVWSPVTTNTLMNGWTDFSDAELRNYPARFYRVRQW